MRRGVRQKLTEEQQAALPDEKEVKRILDAFFDFRRYGMSVSKEWGQVIVEFEDFLPCSTIHPLLAPLLAPYSLELYRRYSDEALAGQLFALCDSFKYRVRREDGSTGHFDIIKRELCTSLKEVPLEESDSAYLMRLMSERMGNTAR